MAQINDNNAGQEPAERSFSGALTKGLAGALGIVCALAVDYYQKGTDSALIYGTKFINEAALARFHIDAVSPLVYLAVVLIAGFAMVYIFEPSNKRNAFYAGAGVLGFLATFSPIAEQGIQFTTAAPEAATPAPAPDGGHAWNGAPGFGVEPAVYRPAPAGSSIVRVQTGIPVTIRIQFPATQGANIPRVRAWLHDNLSNRTLTLGAGARLEQTPSGPVIIYDTSMSGSPSGATLADFVLRVEAPGYKIATKEVTVTKDTPLPVKVEASLEPSQVPLGFQRLQYPYRW